MPTRERATNPVLDEILETNIVRDRTGTAHPVRANVDEYEGQLIYDLIRQDDSIRKTLEVGCAFGLSSLFICSALAGRDHAQHTMIDPFQHRDWHGVGVFNLERAGFTFTNLIESPSELALPELLKHGEGGFDLVLIDGWHTFDHTLVDLFYASRLVRNGGYIVIDDTSWPSVSKAVSYFTKYPCYKVKAQTKLPLTWRRAVKKLITTVIPRAIAPWILPKQLYDRYYVRIVFSSMVALQKTGKDERTWTWYRPF